MRNFDSILLMYLDSAPGLVSANLRSEGSSVDSPTLLRFLFARLLRFFRALSFLISGKLGSRLDSEGGSNLDRVYGDSGASGPSGDWKKPLVLC